MTSRRNTLANQNCRGDLLHYNPYALIHVYMQERGIEEVEEQARAQSYLWESPGTVCESECAQAVCQVLRNR